MLVRGGWGLFSRSCSYSTSSNSHRCRPLIPGPASSSLVFCRIKVSWACCRRQASAQTCGRVKQKITEPVGSRGSEAAATTGWALPSAKRGRQMIIRRHLSQDKIVVGGGDRDLLTDQASSIEKSKLNASRSLEDASTLRNRGPRRIVRYNMFEVRTYPWYRTCIPAHELLCQDR